MKKIFNKKGEVIGSFDPERDEREEQEWLKQGELTPDASEAGWEAAYDELYDEEHCQKLIGKFARKSAKRTSSDIGDIRDRYETIVTEFLAVRYTQPDGRRYSLGSVLRENYETDGKLKQFLKELSEWIPDYVSRCICSGRPYNWKLNGADDVRAVASLRGCAVSEQMMTALAFEYARDREGLMQFLSAVFKQWRQLLAPDSGFRVKLLTQQMETRNVKEFAEYLERIGVVEKNTPAEKLHAKIKQYRSRDRKNALEKRKKAR
ncbi:MAG TPA: hypothetical protein VFU37_16075 [Pyrinomonadaceae bacterium]|nr:hypothetical protein [Pyrinomonadaceae bacterium]